MDSSLLERKFENMGARVKFGNGTGRNRNNMSGGGVRLNVLEDKKGEFFELAAVGGDSPDVTVLDVQPSDRHLLLLVRNGQEKSKFLCGHDERHWFVAAIPETAPVGNVRQAKEALKPQEVQNRQVGLGAKKRNKRKNEAYTRQGEWFFLPENISPANKDLILKNEPITRGNGSKPHMCEFMYRSGGETVWVCSRYPSGVTPARYNFLLKNEKDAKSYAWRSMRKDAAVYVKGRISHADHATITLNGWHRVVMNTESRAAAMRQVAFLD